MINNALHALNKYYGYDKFRKGQDTIVREILDKKDVVAIMPTGGGKSICFQIPALLLEGVTVVISPLISLMKDQVDSIKKLGIEAEYINSSKSDSEILSILDAVNSGKVKMLYIAPERLESSQFLTLMSRVNISQIAVDEAHCVSQWGHDFRTSYRNIKGFISSLSIRPVISAFTATATQEVRDDIVSLLGLNKPNVYVAGFDRENLKINVLNGVNKKQYILDYINENSEQSGIIYAATRKEVDNIYQMLKAKGYSIGRYHAGLSDSERMKMQEDFVYDRLNVIVATNAFGMGIDKPNVRFVIHNNITKNIEAYYQEIGRAGRDGEESECILLFAPSDIQTQRYLIDIGLHNEVRKQSEYDKLQNMVDFVFTSDCYKEYILNYFGDLQAHRCDNCSNCNSTGELTDKSIEAKKVLSCIYRMKKPYGVNMLIDVLRGSQNSKVKGFALDKISTYGVMKEYSKEGLKNFINTLISHNCVEYINGEYPTIRLNETSIKILKDEEKVVLKEITKVHKKSTNNQLFEILRVTRKVLAEKEGVPSYFIFGDTTLKEMSLRHPVNNAQFVDISGVGDVKAEKYGEVFLDKIREYVNANNIVVDWSFRKSTTPKTEINSNRGKSSNITIDMLKEGYSLLEVCEKRNLTISTVIAHITDYYKEENALGFNINCSGVFDELIEKEVLEAIKVVGFERLKPIKERLSGDISYDQIRVIIIKNYYK